MLNNNDNDTNNNLLIVIMFIFRHCFSGEHSSFINKDSLSTKTKKINGSKSTVHDEIFYYYFKHNMCE